jgi:hypothetical protein
MADCGHLCCAIWSNPYHTHLRPPEACLGCLRYRAHKKAPTFGEPEAFVRPGRRPQIAFPISARSHPCAPALFAVPELSDVEHMDADLDHVVRNVLQWLVPACGSDLSNGERLRGQVLNAALHVYGEALEDRDLEGLELRLWRRVLVARVLGRLAPTTAEG